MARWITVIHKCDHHGRVPAGKDDRENSIIEAKAKLTYCPMCQEAIDEHNDKAEKEGRTKLKF